MLSEFRRCSTPQLLLASIPMGLRKAALQKSMASLKLSYPGADWKVVLSELEWSDLKVILALFRGGSVAGASRILGVDSSTISRRLTAAEEALGAILVQRGGREFRFTPEGTMALHAAETMEATMHSAASAIKAAKQSIDGKVIITCVGSFFHILTPFCELVEKNTPTSALRSMIRTAWSIWRLARPTLQSALHCPKNLI